MNKHMIWVLLVVVIIVAAVSVAMFMPAKTTAPQHVPVAEEPVPPQGNDGIEVSLPKANGGIASPLTIAGITKGNGWNGFEGQVGTVQLLDSQGNQLALGILTAQGEWMQPVVNFQTQLSFLSPGSGQKGSLVFHNENASGEPERDKTFTLPIIFQ